MSKFTHIDSSAGKNVFFLDSECVFCKKSTQLIHRLDKHGQIYFAPLQGRTALELPNEWRQLTDANGKPSGAALMAENFGTARVQYWRGADAPLRLMKNIGGIWSVFWLFSYVPGTIKDWVYELIAKNRHRIAGKKEACGLPCGEIRKKTLP
ncbi:MAG: thiol-disulfide oxidoreductase DCC family protein [Akkermansiaceae bacterium]